LKIFISYRRQDSEDITGRIYDRLADRYGADKVFLDIDNIPLGEDFREVVARELEGATAVLAVVGPQWCGQDHTPPRIHEANDFVRLEVAMALTKGIPVLPLFVRGAAMPQSTDLPDDLHPLCFRHGMAVRTGRDFRRDLESLNAWLDGLGKDASKTYRDDRPHVSQPLVDSVRKLAEQFPEAAMNPQSGLTKQLQEGLTSSTNEPGSLHSRAENALSPLQVEILKLHSNPQVANEAAQKKRRLMNLKTQRKLDKQFLLSDGSDERQAQGKILLAIMKLENSGLLSRMGNYRWTITDNGLTVLRQLEPD
jgi:hypothetical protein